MEAVWGPEDWDGGHLWARRLGCQVWIHQTGWALHWDCSSWGFTTAGRTLVKERRWYGRMIVLLGSGLEDDLYWIVPHVQPTTWTGKRFNWIELRLRIKKVRVWALVLVLDVPPPPPHPSSGRVLGTVSTPHCDMKTRVPGTTGVDTSKMDKMRPEQNLVESFH